MNETGFAQSTKPAPSRLHSKVTPPSFDVKAKFAVVELLGFDGPLEMVVSGAVTSTLQVCDAGVASTLPAASRARTWKVCDVCERPL